ncbi:MAG: cardiolipin synthase [Bacteroidia bacterium]|nr:cardiolipin synthase [Bacteroidia bacterium]
MNSVLIFILEILYALTIISVVIVVISENRNPIKTLSWVMVLVFLPFVGLIWYLTFGQDFTKKQIITKRMYSKLKKRPLDEIGTLEEVAYPKEHASLIRLLKNLDNTPLLGGNNVQLFTRGDEKLERLLIDIENAKEHIHVEYYAFENDAIGAKVRNALIQKSLQGVEVRVIYDSFGSRKAKKGFFEEFRKAGIEVEPFLKLALPKLTSRLNFRNHRKMVIIDGRIGYVGGMNIADRYIDGFQWGIWRDTHARIEGKGVQGLQSIFLIDWFFVSQTLITSRKYFPELPAFGNIAMQTVNSGPLREEREISHGILQAIYDAQKSIFIQTPYFVPPESLLQALQAAAVRGLDVRVMIPKRSDVRLVHLATLSFLKEVLQSGIKVYLYEKGFLHSKMMVFDDSLTLIGSVNFDSRSFEHNFEVEAFIYDCNVAKKAIDIFVEDQRFSQIISSREWMKRPQVLRFFESLMRLFAPLL